MSCEIEFVYVPERNGELEREGESERRESERKNQKLGKKEAINGKYHIKSGKIDEQ